MQFIQIPLFSSFIYEVFIIFVFYLEVLIITTELLFGVRFL